MNKRKNYIIHDPTFCTEEKRLLLINAVRWFLDRYKMQLTEFKGDFDRVHIRVNACQYKDLKCYGQCYEWDGEKIDYVIDVAIDQSIRDTLATIFHECVHLWQWERGDWKGEGEREAASLQYELADEYWKSGNV
jgi:hypothetical protein